MDQQTRPLQPIFPVLHSSTPSYLLPPWKTLAACSSLAKHKKELWVSQMWYLNTIFYIQSPTCDILMLSSTSHSSQQFLTASEEPTPLEKDPIKQDFKKDIFLCLYSSETERHGSLPDSHFRHPPPPTQRLAKQECLYRTYDQLLQIIWDSLSRCI